MTRYETVQVSFGKYRGESLAEIYERDPDYICWLAAKSFSDFVKNACRVFLRDKRKERDEAFKQQKRVWQHEFYAANSITPAAPETRGRYIVMLSFSYGHEFHIPGDPASAQRQYGIELGQMYRGRGLKFGNLRRDTALAIARDNRAAGHSPRIWKGDLTDGREIEF